MNKQVFTIKVIKDRITKEFEIPLHKEFVFVRTLENGNWQVKNTETNQICTVVKSENDKFVTYDFSCI